MKHERIRIITTTDDMALSYTNEISELLMVRDGVLAFTDPHFSTADACSSIIEFLCTA